MAADGKPAKAPRLQLLTGKAVGLMWEAALAPLNAMVQSQEQA